MFADEEFKAKVTAIDKPETFSMNHEMGFAAKYTSSSSTASEVEYTSTALVLDGHTMKFPDGAMYFGYIHSHVNFVKGNPTIKIFSPGDVATFLTSCLINAKAHGNIGDAFAMIITSEGNYMLQYTLSDDNFSLTEDMLKKWKVWYRDKFQEMIENDEATQEKVEKMFMKFLSEKVKIAGTELYKIEKGTGKAFRINNNGTKIPCT